MDIDYEELKLALLSDIDRSLHDQFNIDEMLHNAILNEEEATIMVKFHDGWFKYDANTYEQIAGGGGIKDE